MKVRLAKQPKTEKPEEEKKPTEDSSVPRGMSERQWFISLLVVSGLLLLLTFRGCILPSGVGPKVKPTPQPSATAQPSSAPATGSEYTVQGGDTLSAIATKHNVSLEALAQANGIDLDRPVILKVGQTLKIPK